MRVMVVPLEGRRGLLLGTLLPCALFYFLRLYRRRRRRRFPPPSAASGLAGVSARAASIAAAPVSYYYAGIAAALSDPYHPHSNPHGILQLGLAENHLSLDLLRGWLIENLESVVLGDARGDSSITELATYQPFDGLMDLKIVVARFMGLVMQGSVSFNASQIVLTSGSTPAIEILAFCLADPGDGFLVPSPYYPGFVRDVKLRTGVELIPIPCSSTDNFNLSIDALKSTYNQAMNRKIKVRAILITNPSNPVGTLLNLETMHRLLDFASEKNIHIISDEVYAGSVYGDEAFTSFAEFLGKQEVNNNRVHIVYGLSKDLCLPGFRIGAIYSYNEGVLTAAKKMARFSSISVPSQKLAVSLLSDVNFLARFIETNKNRLRRMYNLVRDGLRQLGITCVDSTGGFYCWMDMSKHISSSDERGEIELWDRLLNTGKINVTPGSSCHCMEPGWFRCCFASLTEGDIPVFIDRIRWVIENA